MQNTVDKLRYGCFKEIGKIEGFSYKLERELIELKQKNEPAPLKSNTLTSIGIKHLNKSKLNWNMHFCLEDESVIKQVQFFDGLEDI